MGICSSCDDQPHCHNFHRESTHYNSQQKNCIEQRNTYPSYYTHSVPRLDNFYSETCGGPICSKQVYSEPINNQYYNNQSYQPEYYLPPQVNNTVKHIAVSSSPSNYYEK